MQTLYDKKTTLFIFRLSIFVHWDFDLSALLKLTGLANEIWE